MKLKKPKRPLKPKKPVRFLFEEIYVLKISDNTSKDYPIQNVEGYYHHLRCRCRLSKIKEIRETICAAISDKDLILEFFRDRVGFFLKKHNPSYKSDYEKYLAALDVYKKAMAKYNTSKKKVKDET